MPDPTEPQRPETPEERAVHVGDDPEAGDDDAPAPTPFDHPLFIPALLFAFALWFGYDGWLNDDPDMQEHLTFNRVGFFVVLGFLAWTGRRGLQELRELRRGDAASEGAEPRAEGDDRRSG